MSVLLEQEYSSQYLIQRLCESHSLGYVLQTVFANYGHPFPEEFMGKVVKEFDSMMKEE